MACVAIIAAVAYFFWGEYQKFAEARAADAAHEAALTAACVAMRDDLRTIVEGGSLDHRFSQAEARAALLTCVIDRRLADADVEGLGVL